MSSCNFESFSIGVGVKGSLKSTEFYRVHTLPCPNDNLYSEDLDLPGLGRGTEVRTLHGFVRKRGISKVSRVYVTVKGRPRREPHKSDDRFL